MCYAISVALQELDILFLFTADLLQVEHVDHKCYVLFCFCRGVRRVESHFSLMTARRHLPQTGIICSLYSDMTG